MIVKLCCDYREMNIINRIKTQKPLFYFHLRGISGKLMKNYSGNHIQRKLRYL